jgi:hypothetical protein
MRIFIRDHNSSPELAVRRALSVLVEAGIYSADGGGTLGDQALILIDAAHIPEAVGALTKAGMRASVG